MPRYDYLTPEQRRRRIAQLLLKGIYAVLDREESEKAAEKSQEPVLRAGALLA